MNTETIKNIFSVLGLPSINEISKLEVGFSNEVYSVNNQYILKICKDPHNEKAFKRESILYYHFKDKLPVPQLINYNDSKDLYDRDFMIYHKIHGENLYNVWHKLKDHNRKDLIRQLCKMLQIISSTPLEDLPSGFDLNPLPNWQDFVLKEFKKYLSILEQAGTVTETEATKIKSYVQAHKSSLNQQKIALVYWDVHFDNVLVKDGNIVGLLDFERTELASIDFTLNIVKRMVEQPKKYMSKYAEQFANDEDYKDLLVWYREYYPELFRFNELNRRLDIYEIVNLLKELKNYSHVTELKSSLVRKLEAD